MEFQNRFLLRRKLSELGVDIRIRRLCQEITVENAVIMDLEKLQRKVIDADVVVMAVGVIPDNGLAQTLKGKTMEPFFIGDCIEQRKAVNAIHQASFIARQMADISVYEVE
jgi:NAD(P)H-nitrite reductase large subunit